MIEAFGLSKNFAALAAVSELSFRLKEGEVVALLGQNGSGKTTTMRMLSTFILPTAGTAQVAGYDVLRQGHEVRRHIGYLPEFPPLYPELCVDDYLAFVAQIKGVPRLQRKSSIEAVVQRCGLAEVYKRPCQQLSRGFRQRLGLAQAIIHEPPVLILDEPTGGLDPSQMKETRELIKNFAGKHTVLLSTHLLSEVIETCSRVLIVAGGKILLDRSLAEIPNRRSLEEAFMQAVGS